jgi:RNA polymerase sigma-70 factor, ECF subfamily
VDTDPDAVLVRACIAGDRAAFESLLARYERTIYNLAFRMLRNPEDALDVVQVVFLTAYERMAQFNFEHRFYSWIYRIAINESIDVLNGRKREYHADEDADQHTAERTLMDDRIEAELGVALRQAMMTLPTDYRAVIVLRHFVDCSYHQIAEVLGVPEKTVKSRLFTARQLLRQRLETTGLSA